MLESKGKLVETLVDVGLSQNQAKVYIASRLLGPSKAAEIARVAQLKRSTVYPVIESLEKLGLMSIQMKGFKRQYYAESPNRLEHLIELRHRQLSQSLDELHSLGSRDETFSTIKHFDSLAAIKNVYESLIADIEPKQDYMIFSSSQEIYDLDPEFFEDFFLRRGRLDIRIRALLKRSSLADTYLREGGERYNVETRVFPSSVDFTANLVITPQRLLIHQVVAPTWAVVIENPYIIRLHQVLFESFWESVPEPQVSSKLL